MKIVLALFGSFTLAHVWVICLLQVMFSSVLHKRLPAEAGISVVCVSPGIVHTNVVSSQNISLSSYLEDESILQYD